MGCDVILIEGVEEVEQKEGYAEEKEGDPGGIEEGNRSGTGTKDLAAAVMNRLRKAAAG